MIRLALTLMVDRARLLFRSRLELMMENWLCASNWLSSNSSAQDPDSGPLTSRGAR